jgi:hypothetical protein
MVEKNKIQIFSCFQKFDKNQVHLKNLDDTS